MASIVFAALYTAAPAKAKEREIEEGCDDAVYEVLAQRLVRRRENLARIEI
jgi:hypothetical protein